MPLSDQGKHPLRQQRKRTKGWRKPSGAVCVSRPSQWSNPFPVVKENPLLAVTRFETYVLPDLDVSGLRGKVLLCWCSEDAPCHADVLAWAANGTGGKKASIL